MPPLVREGDHYRADVHAAQHDEAGAMKASLARRMRRRRHCPRQTVRDRGRRRGRGRLGRRRAIQREDALHGRSRRMRARAHDRMKVEQQVARGRAGDGAAGHAGAARQAICACRSRRPRTRWPDGQGGLRGGIDVALKPRLGDGLPGVREYFERYPWTCLEQQASIAIGLRDTVPGKQLVAQLPLYLDEDGLANYFPPRHRRAPGSDSLTAYLLAISDEATQARLRLRLARRGARPRWSAG